MLDKRDLESALHHLQEAERLLPMGIREQVADMASEVEDLITDNFRERDPEAEAERRYFDMMDPAYQRDLRTPWWDTLEADSRYDDQDYPEEGE